MSDRITEINSLASERVGSALSKLLRKKINVVFSHYETKDIKNLIPSVGAEKIISAVYLPLESGTTGDAAVIFNADDALLFSRIVEKSYGQSESKEINIDVIKETGNIVLGNYLAILSNKLKIEILGGVPRYNQGMYGAVLEDIIANAVKAHLKALIVEIEFAMQDMAVKGYLYVILGTAIVEKLVS